MILKIKKLAKIKLKLPISESNFFFMIFAIIFFLNDILPFYIDDFRCTGLPEYIKFDITTGNIYYTGLSIMFLFISIILYDREKSQLKNK